MRFSKLLIRIFTLSVFIILIAGFVLYRVWYQREASRLNAVKTREAKQIDSATAPTNFTIYKPKDSAVIANPAYMSGSKSSSVVPVNFSFAPALLLIDTLKIPDATEMDSIIKAKEKTEAAEAYMYSSKSMQLSDPALLYDSARKPQLKTIIDSIIKNLRLKPGKKQ